MQGSTISNVRRLTLRDEDLFLTIAEAAYNAGVSEKTIRRKLKSGELPCIRRNSQVVRIPIDEFNMWAYGAATVHQSPSVKVDPARRFCDDDSMQTAIVKGGKRQITLGPGDRLELITADELAAGSGLTKSEISKRVADGSLIAIGQHGSDLFFTKATLQELRARLPVVPGRPIMRPVEDRMIGPESINQK